MATVTQLLDRISQVTGLQNTGTERALALQALNDAYVTAIQEAGSYRVSSTKTLTSGTSDYDITASPLSFTDVLQFTSLTASGGGSTNVRMVQVPESKLLQMRENNTTVGGTASIYYAMGGDSLLRLYPTPGSSYTVTFTYVKAPPTLVESAPGAGEESTPSRIPARFHWSVLVSGALSTAFSKDQRKDDIGFWQQVYQSGLASYLEYVNRFGGEPASVMPNDPMVGGVDEYPRIWR